jgi:hypothetical protein
MDYAGRVGQSEGRWQKKDNPGAKYDDVPAALDRRDMQDARKLADAKKLAGMNKSQSITKGDMVEFHTPDKSELGKDGKQIPMKILEDNGDRVLAEYQTKGIRQTQTLLKKDLKRNVPERSFMHEVYGQNKSSPELRAKLSIQNMSDTKAQALISRDGGKGFTHSFRGEPEPTTGYTFAETEGKSYSPKDLTPTAIKTFAKSKSKSLSQSGNFLGGYINPDTGLFDVDVSTNIKDKSEAMKRATAAHQTSIWDVVNKKEIFTGIKKGSKK